MTDKQEWMLARRFWLFRNSFGVVSGEPINEPFNEHLFRFRYTIVGKSAIFHCFTQDETVTSIEAIAFCKMILDCNFRVVHVDLSKV